ncbi:MAG TPA: homoserine dehydrogenase, partial [Gammaproteobacteria bacterium]|nr:homoserine dehydrogenase [Gammaproteobacteria bacterium]
LPYETLSYEDCLKIPYPVVQHKAIKFAKAHDYHFSVKSLNGKTETKVGFVSKIYEEEYIHQKKRIILLGLGTVGYGVYQHLTASPHLFEIVGIGVSNPEKHANISADLFTDLDELFKRDADIVIELIGGLAIAEKYITKALQKKCHVITANKLLIAEKGSELHNLAALHSVNIIYSAAVCGAVPVLEFLSQFKRHYPRDEIQSITGILNGTCNFILDEMSDGSSYKKALARATKEGFAESDPFLDISGLDTAHKLKILARLAFQKELPHLVVQGINENIKEQSTKLIAHCELKGNQLQAFVLPQAISKDHPLINIKNVDNGVLIKTIQGKTFYLRGKGAGRLPTALAVYADLLAIYLDTHCELKNNALRQKVAI